MAYPEQHSSTVRKIKCPGSTVLVDTLTRSITWLSRGDFEVALKIYVTERWPILVILGLIGMLRLRTAAIEQPDEMKRQAPTYFSRRLKSAAKAPLFNQSVEEHMHNFRSHCQPNLNWDAVKEVYWAAGMW